MLWALTAAIVVNRISTGHLLEFYLLDISSSDRHLVQQQIVIQTWKSTLNTIYKLNFCKYKTQKWTKIFCDQLCICTYVYIYIVHIKESFQQSKFDVKKLLKSIGLSDTDYRAEDNSSSAVVALVCAGRRDFFWEKAACKQQRKILIKSPTPPVYKRVNQLFCQLMAQGRN